MSTEVRLRRGTTAQHSSFTGALGEVTVDTDKKTLVVHDGSTIGGSTVLLSDAIIDENDMASNSATKVPTQKSVRAYADTKAPLITSVTGSFPADSAPGSNYAGYAFNTWQITDAATVGPSPGFTRQAYGILINDLVGGETLRGTRNALSSQIVLTAPSEASEDAVQNYVAGQFIASAVAGDNGTDTGAGAKGAVFAINPVAALNPGATNFLHLSCGEWNIGAVAGSSMRYKSFTNFANYPSDAVKGSEVDTILWFYKQGASGVGFDHGLLFSNEIGGVSDLQLISTTGTFITAEGGGTSADGFDFVDWNFTGAILKAKNFQITATGAVYSRGLVRVLGGGGGGGHASVQAAILPVAQADGLGKMSFGYENQSTFAESISAYISAFANGAWTEGVSHPSYLSLFATSTATITPVEVARLIPDEAVANKTPIFFLIGGEGLVQVEVGENDSAGVGYRQLRVVNS